MYDVLIIGGGLAGLVNAIQLSKEGLKVGLIEKKQYPFHRVCGEYISNEVVPYLRSIDAYPDFLKFPDINTLRLSDTKGRFIDMPLPLGGFGVSRYTLDNFLYTRAIDQGTNFLLRTQATAVDYNQDKDNFTITLSDSSTVTATIVIGAYGKRSRLDKSLNRDFFQERSPYIGVKYHIKSDFPQNTIALHNFENGYCGISQVEDGKQNLCYLSHRDNLKSSGDIKRLEEEVLCQNPHLKQIFEKAAFINAKPFVINEISFAPKSAVESHILMAGDAAGMITPLCGNGMAMAIHSAKLLSELIIKHTSRASSLDRHALESEYTSIWNRSFKRRLQTGRLVQRLFGNAATSAFTVALAKRSKLAAKMLIRQTHGEPF